MDEAYRLRELAARCREVANGLNAKATADTLHDMARQFERSAEATARLPVPPSPAASRPL